VAPKTSKNNTKTAAAKSNTKGPTNVTSGTAATNNHVGSVTTAPVTANHVTASHVTATTNNTSGKHVNVGDSSLFVPRRSWFAGAKRKSDDMATVGTQQSVNKTFRIGNE